MSKDLTLLFVEQFRLCKLQPAETVAVIAELGHKDAHVQAAVRAAQMLGAAAVVLQAPSISHADLPPYAEDQRGMGALIAAAGECDLVVDATRAGIVHSDVRTRITGAGKRMFFVAEPAGVLERLTGTPELRATVEAGGKLLREGSTMRVASEAGTDLTLNISGEDLPITLQYGYVDEPGRWDHWPSGFIACFPKDRSAQGRIVLQPGDMLLQWLRPVGSLVTLKIEDGFIVDVAGDGTDAFMLRDYFKAWKDPEVWALSHAGWGVHPHAAFSAIDVYPPGTLYGQDFRSAAGNFMWSTGSNRFANRFTSAHLDIPMHSCTVRIDDHPVVSAGELV